MKYKCKKTLVYLQLDCGLLEKLQRGSARFVKADYRKTSSVSLRLALLYKIVTGYVAIPDQIGLVAADNRTRANRRYNSGQ